MVRLACPFSQFNPTAKLALILCIALDKKFEELFYFKQQIQAGKPAPGDKHTLSCTYPPLCVGSKILIFRLSDQCFYRMKISKNKTILIKKDAEVVFAVKEIQISGFLAALHVAIGDHGFLSGIGKDGKVILIEPGGPFGNAASACAHRLVFAAASCARKHDEHPEKQSA